MSRKKNRIELKLVFDSPQMRAGMLEFFRTYTQQLPAFLKEKLQQAQIPSDPAMSIHDDEIRFMTIDTNKGAVLVYNDKQDGFLTVDYKLVPNDERYLRFDRGLLIAFFKRGGAADEDVAAFDSMAMALAGCKTLEDPKEIQKKIAAIDARDAEKTAAVMEEVEEAKMEVVKDENE